MEFGSSPPLDDSPAATAWQEIEAGLQELSRLARSGVTADELHSRLLERLVQLLAAAGGMVWRVSADTPPSLACQMNLDQALGGDREELARHQRLAALVAASNQPRVVPPAYRDAEVANASPWLAILCPIIVEDEALAVVGILQRPAGRAAVEEGFLRLVCSGCEIAEEFHRGRALRELRQKQTELGELADFVQRIHRRLDLPATAAEIANEACRLIGCDRVAVVMTWGRSPRVLAVSGVTTFDRRSGYVAAVEHFARLGVPAGEAIWHPDAADDSPPGLNEGLQALLDEADAQGIGFLPLVADEQNEEAACGLLLIEQFAVPFTSEQQAQARLVSRASGPALANAALYQAIPLRGPQQWLAAKLGLAPQSRRSPVWAVLGVSSVVCLALWLVPARLTVEARGELMPKLRQHVFAPSNGVVIELPRHEGNMVRKGQLLAKLHSPTLDIDESELVGKQRTLQEQLVAAETTALRSEQEGIGRESAGQVSARVLQLKEELRGIESQLVIVRQQQTAQAVLSPLDGMVVTWDTEQQLTGRPVKRGDELVTVADTSGAWELLLDLPEWRVGHVLAAASDKAGLPVSFQVGTDVGKLEQGKVATIAPATQISSDGQPAVRIVVDLPSGERNNYRPGAAVVARIDCGRRSLGYVWLHGIWEAIRQRLFV